MLYNTVEKEFINSGVFDKKLIKNGRKNSPPVDVIQYIKKMEETITENEKLYLVDGSFIVESRLRIVRRIYQAINQLFFSSMLPSYFCVMVLYEDRYKKSLWCIDENDNDKLYLQICIAKYSNVFKNHIDLGVWIASVADDIIYMLEKYIDGKLNIPSPICFTYKCRFCKKITLYTDNFSTNCPHCHRYHINDVYVQPPFFSKSIMC